MISPATKKAVHERDGGCCILCGLPGRADAHYISRAQSGLGVEQNIVTLCAVCHREYDQSTVRPLYRQEIRIYLQSKYPDWNEKELTYKKWED